MLATEQFAFREKLSKEGIVFCYSGYLTEKVLTSIGETLRRKLELENTDKKTARSVFHVFVEQVQNVIRYSSEKEPLSKPEDEGCELHFGLLTVGFLEGKYFVNCANMVDSHDVAKMKTSLAAIQKMSPDELKTLYKEILRGETPEGSKGAGAGLVDIARTATKGFEYDFAPVDEKNTYFSLKAYI